ncbi:hypothetical protein Bca4012_092685 [Brassica carinata]
MALEGVNRSHHRSDSLSMQQLVSVEQASMLYRCSYNLRRVSTSDYGCNNYRISIALFPKELMSTTFPMPQSLSFE